MAHFRAEIFVEGKNSVHRLAGKHGLKVVAGGKKYKLSINIYNQYNREDTGKDVFHIELLDYKGNFVKKIAEGNLE